MRVLMQSRKNFFDLKGGDTVQLTKTKDELQKLGVDVDLSLDFSPDLTNYDLVHLSNVTRIQETYLQVKNAVSQCKPIVLSTIFWPMEDFERRGQVGIRKFVNEHFHIDNIERIKATARFLKNKDARNIATKNLITVGYTKMQRYVVDNTNFFLPNAELEMEALEDQFSFKTSNYVVVPNAVDLISVNEAESEPIPSEFEKYRDAVICVGRIEPRKNQVSLAKALENSGYKLLFVGAVSTNQKEYFKELLEIVEQNNNFYYEPYIDNKELYKLYRICKVSALPSWLDTPGLVSLEAAAMGCNLAISSKGTTKEYFRQYASYCEPDNLKSIRKAVDDAFNKPRQEELINLIKSEYNWENAALQTLKGYEMALQEYNK